MVSHFKCFNENMKSFFLGLSQNNNKVWFDNNRIIYENEVKIKSQLFVNRMSELFINNNFPYIADNKHSLYRINRDIRFSKNKEPYKTNLGIFFPYSRSYDFIRKEFPLGIYIHFEPQRSFISIGVHNPDSESLKKVRSYIYNHFEDYESIIQSSDFKREYPEEITFHKPLTRINGFSKDHPSYEFLKKKEFIYLFRLEDKVFFSDDFTDFVLEKANYGLDYNNFLYEAVYNTF